MIGQTSISREPHLGKGARGDEYTLFGLAGEAQAMGLWIAVSPRPGSRLLVACLDTGYKGPAVCLEVLVPF